MCTFLGCPSLHTLAIACIHPLTMQTLQVESWMMWCMDCWDIKACECSPLSCPCNKITSSHIKSESSRVYTRFNYPTHTCAARGNVIGFVQHKNCQISTLGIGQKLTPLCFESFGKAHKGHKTTFYIGHAYHLHPFNDFCSCTQPSRVRR